MLSSLPGGFLGARYGSPPAAVVALHGWRRSNADFAAVLEGFDAVAPDLPGFGSAAPPVEAWGAAAYAEAVVPLCSEGPPVVLLGHSFGGRVAVALAANHPDRVKALVLTGVPLLRPAGQVRPRVAFGYRVARRLHRVGMISEDRMEQRRRRSGSEDYQAAAGVMRDVLVRVIGETNDGTYRGWLPEISCPVELVWGAGDTAAPPAIASEAAALLATANVTVVAGAGHLTPADAPEALRAALERHL